jgi:RNA polymerase sigma factor (sigma-70 family)
LELLETITHEEMVEKCKRGDPSGYTGLYQRHSKEVYNTIYRLVNHTAEAEDLLQETFVAAFNAIGRFEHTGGFRAWIKRIAINKSLSYLRKRRSGW